MEPNAASVALIDGDRVLLIQRAFEPYGGLWTLPGGRHEAGETIQDTAIREIKEELALDVIGLKPVQAMRLSTGFLLQVFATQAFSGEIRPSVEIADWRWLRPDEIGDLTTTPDLDDVLARAFALFDKS